MGVGRATIFADVMGDAEFITSWIPLTSPSSPQTIHNLNKSAGRCWWLCNLHYFPPFTCRESEKRAILVSPIVFFYLWPVTFSLVFFFFFFCSLTRLLMSIIYDAVAVDTTHLSNDSWNCAVNSPLIGMKGQVSGGKNFLVDNLHFSFLDFLKKAIVSS